MTHDQGERLENGIGYVNVHTAKNQGGGDPRPAQADHARVTRPPAGRGAALEPFPRNRTPTGLHGADLTDLQGRQLQRGRTRPRRA